MKRKTGFTLIELLAVIVILAIIALIATPMILGIIESSKKGALKDSAYGLIESAELYYVQHEEAKKTTTEFTFENGKQSSESKLEYKGQIEAGKLILYETGDIALCIQDGNHYAMKQKENPIVVMTQEGCVFDPDNGFIIGGTSSFAINPNYTTDYLMISAPYKNTPYMTVSTGGTQNSVLEPYLTKSVSFATVKGEVVTIEEDGIYTVQADSQRSGNTGFALRLRLNGENIGVTTILPEAVVNLNTTFAAKKGDQLQLSFDSYQANVGVLSYHFMMFKLTA